MRRHLALAESFWPQTQAFLAVEPIDYMSPDIPVFALQDDMDTPVTIFDVRLADLSHSLSEFRSWVARKPFALHRAMLTGQTAGSPLALAVGLHHVIDNLFISEGRGTFLKAYPAGQPCPD